MIPKKLISYCMFAIFAFNYSDAFGMDAVIKKPTSNNNPQYMALQYVLLHVMQMNIRMELNGVDEQKTVEDQWKRFIEYTLEENQITHNVLGLLPEWYDSFIEKINIPDNRTSYLNLIQLKLRQNDYLSFNEFFSDVTIKNIFIDLGKTFVNSLPNSPANQAVRILNNTVNPANPSKKEVFAALSMLGLEGKTVILPKEIESAYRKLALQYHPDKGGTTEQMQALVNAKDILLSEEGNISNSVQLVVPAPSPVSVPTSSPKHSSDESEIDQRKISEVKAIVDQLRLNKSILPMELQSSIHKIAILVTSIDEFSFPKNQLINASINVLNLRWPFTQQNINDAYDDVKKKIDNDTALQNNADVFAYVDSAILQARSILRNNFNKLSSFLVVPAPSPKHRRIKNPTVDHQPQIISDAFRQRIQDVGMSIAKKMLEKNILVNEQNLTMTLQDLNIVIWGMENNQSEKMAYLMGYVQNCIYQLQKSSGNSAPMIVNLAEVLKALNQKAARA